MTDLFTRIAERMEGADHLVRPIRQPRFGPEPISTAASEPSNLFADQFEDDRPGVEQRRETMGSGESRGRRPSDAPLQQEHQDRKTSPLIHVQKQQDQLARKPMPENRSTGSGAISIPAIPTDTSRQMTPLVPPRRPERENTQALHQRDVKPQAPPQMRGELPREVEAQLEHPERPRDPVAPFVKTEQRPIERVVKTDKVLGEGVSTQTTSTATGVLVANPKSQQDQQLVRRQQRTDEARWQRRKQKLTEKAPSQQPTIKVTIGRVEVRAIQEAPPVATRKRANAKPALSLEAYLEQRSQGKR